MKKSRVLILVFSIWMYFGGPLVWGAWIVWRLQIYSSSEFLTRLLPTGIAILAFFFLVHSLNLRRFGLEPSSRQALRYPPAVGMHLSLIAVFGTFGTVAFLILPVLFPPGNGSLDSPTVERMLIGAMAGTSLVGLFYPFFSTKLLSQLPGYQRTRVTIRRFNIAAYLTGVFAYVVAGLWAARQNGITLAGLLGLLVPLVMSVLLMWKTVGLTQTPVGVGHDAP